MFNGYNDDGRNNNNGNDYNGGDKLKWNWFTYIYRGQLFFEKDYNYLNVILKKLSVSI